MATKPRGSIIVTFLNDPDHEAAEFTNDLRMHVETVIRGEEGRRLQRALKRATGGHDFIIRQEPAPKAPEALTRTLSTAERARREAETAEFFAQRGERRRAAQAWATATRRLEDRGHDMPGEMAIRDELKRMATEADNAIAASTKVTRRGLGTDAVVEQILGRKAS